MAYESEVVPDEAATVPDIETAASGADGAQEQRERMLVAKITRTIQLDKKHHAKAFKRMRRDMHVAMWGAEKEWGEEFYRANIIGRHIKQKTAALYAKNPKARAARKPKLDFAVWDENPASLMLAVQTIEAAQLAMAEAQATPPAIDPMTGAVVAPAPQPPPGFEQAMALLEDFQQGMQRRELYTKVGKTLEILYQYYLDEQHPVDFKTGMKQVVRRALTCGVGYVELDYQRVMGPRPGRDDHIADYKQRIDHLRKLMQERADGEIDEVSAEVAELELALASLEAEPEIVLREGLAVDFPLSTRVIPDRFCKNLVGFVGARHLTIEYTYTVGEVKEKFGVDISNSYVPYTPNAGSSREIGYNDVFDDDYEFSAKERDPDGLACVWKYFDKATGLVYWIADGYPDFLQPPAPPSVYVESFWPVYALTFNAVESDEELFPPSDVSLLLDPQRDHNQARQGMREHRRAARPRWVSPKGAFGEDDPQVLKSLGPFEVGFLNTDMNVNIQQILQQVPVPSVDPNLYQTEPFFNDTQVVAGTQEAIMGGVAKATATESAIAANATMAFDNAAIDDLDLFLTAIARSASQILLREVPEERAQEIVGPGAVWPDATLMEIADEIYLEVEAGSSGKPNQAVEINNWQQMLPLLLQMGNIDPIWLARETLRRLDDRMDLTEAIAAGIPSVVSQNQAQGRGLSQFSTEDPAADPGAQGEQGFYNVRKPPGGPGGSAAAFGSNQTDRPI